MDYWIWIWLAVVVATMIIEFISVEMIAVWFSAGALVSLITSLFIPYWAQIIVFVVVSLVLLLAFRKIALKYLLGKDKLKTNVDALVGKVYKLLTPIENEKAGTIKINDIVWTAKTEKDDVVLKENTMVEIVNISGNKAIVKEVEKQPKSNDKQQDELKDNKKK